MTQEQKAKAYDEALERAKRVHKYSSDLAEIKRMEQIFPELELEDERLKKELLTWLKNKLTNPSIGFSSIKMKQWIDWLEEQGNPNKDYWRGYKDGKKAILDRYSELKIQDKQKPNVIIPKFKIGDEVITENEGSLTITKIDEKGYWSNDLFICSFDDSAEWELVEPAGWSEEDERMYQNMLNPSDLRPQSHWKPSEEQMYMLEWLTTNVLDDGVVGNKAKEVLYTLIEQLKSL